MKREECDEQFVIRQPSTLICKGSIVQDGKVTKAIMTFSISRRQKSTRCLDEKAHFVFVCNFDVCQPIIFGRRTLQ